MYTCGLTSSAVGMPFWKDRGDIAAKSMCFMGRAQLIQRRFMADRRVLMWSRVPTVGMEEESILPRMLSCLTKATYIAKEACSTCWLQKWSSGRRMCAWIQVSFEATDLLKCHSRKEASQGLTTALKEGSMDVQFT